MFTNLLHSCLDWLIIFMGGYTEFDLMMATAAIKIEYILEQEKLLEELADVRRDYEEVVKELEQLGYAKEDTTPMYGCMSKLFHSEFED